jgi:hypothetical protein
VIVKTVSRVGTETIAVNTACRNFTPAPTCGSWNREHEEQDERDAAHHVAVQAPADGARHQRVEGDVGGHQPEVDDRVQRPGKEHARQARVDRRLEAEGHGQDQEQDLDRGADRRPRPQVGAGQVGEHRQRHGFARVRLLPHAQVHGHQRDPDPRADDHQHDADVVGPVRDQRRVERVQHRGLAQRDGDHRDDRAEDDEGKTDPRPALAGERLLQREFDDGIAEAHRDQRGEHVAHRGTVGGDGAVVQLGVADPVDQRAADDHLPFAQQQGDEEGGEGNPEVGQHELAGFFTEHSSTSFLVGLAPFA